MEQLWIDPRGFLTPIGRMTTSELHELNKWVKANPNTPITFDLTSHYDVGSLISGVSEQQLSLVRYGVDIS